MEFGNINYDVPVDRRSTYSQLRALFRRKAIMQTASSYLFPWGMAKDIMEGIDKINKDKDGVDLPTTQKVRYSIFKYDEKTSGKAIEQSIHDALARMLRAAKENVNKKVHSLFTEEEAEKDPLASAKVSCNKARATLRDARALALIFNMTDNLDAAFLAYEAWVEAKKEAITDWETSAKGVALFEDEQNVAATVSASGAN